LTGTPLVATTDFTYDPGDRLQTWTHNPTGQSPLSYGLSYDPGDRVIQLTQPNGQSSSYSYDRANQVTGATHTFQGPEGFSYDGAGNRTNPGYTTGPNNELLSDGTYTYTNDEEGNRLTRDKPGESTTYEWDYRNRLTRLVITTPTQTVDAHYTYDVFDHRIGKVVTTTVGMSQTTQATRYVYDGDAIALEFDTTNPMAPALTHRYLRAVDQLFADEQLSTMGPGALYWPLTDYQGSVRELLDASGAVVKQYRYDSFGARSVVSGSSSVDEFFAYTGQARDPESGLQQHWHRYYEPPTGRWISVDPIPADSNLYRYVGNGPANATDPRGLKLVVGSQVVEGGSSRLYKEVVFKTAHLKRTTVVEEILKTMIESPVEKRTYEYGSVDELVREINLRLHIVVAAQELAKLQETKVHKFSRDFRKRIVEFPEAKNWRPCEATIQGISEGKLVKVSIEGIAVKKDVKVSAAIDEIFTTTAGKEVYYDCFTAVYLAVHRGLLKSMGADNYDRLFANKDDPRLILASVSGIQPFIKVHEDKPYDLIPGDLRAFDNPGATERSYHNENAIYLGEGRYWAPFVGIMTKKTLLDALNEKSTQKKARDEDWSDRPIVPKR
jgi:RHS repeat-associated protein